MWLTIVRCGKKISRVKLIFAGWIGSKKTCKGSISKVQCTAWFRVNSGVWEFCKAVRTIVLSIIYLFFLPSWLRESVMEVMVRYKLSKKNHFWLNYTKWGSLCQFFLLFLKLKFLNFIKMCFFVNSFFTILIKKSMKNVPNSKLYMLESFNYQFSIQRNRISSIINGFVKKLNSFIIIENLNSLVFHTKYDDCGLKIANPH